MKKLRNKRRRVVDLFLKRIDFLEQKLLKYGISIKEYKEYKSKIRAYEYLRWGLNICCLDL